MLGSSRWLRDLIRTPDGMVRALRDACAHYGAQLSLGKVHGHVAGSDVGDYALSDEQWVVQCPWHGYEFDVESGRCPADPEHTRVRSYPVSVDRGGAIVIDR